jgi:hypothetical protein
MVAFTPNPGAPPVAKKIKILQVEPANSLGIRKAIFMAGGQVKLAEQLGVSQQSVAKWLKQGYTPLGRAIELETRFGIPRRVLIDKRLRELVMPSLFERT